MKNILAISASSREGNSNSALTVLKESALSKGYRFNDFKIKDKRITPCDGCLKCDETGSCVFADDMLELSNQLENADLIVFVTPIYFNAVPGIAKSFIDRLNPFYTSRSLEGKCVGVITFGQTEPEDMEYVVEYLKRMFSGIGVSFWRSACITAKDPNDFIENPDSILKVRRFFD
ncbi:MAG TPA: hypothetical protein DIC60_04715 [Lachnospiraceae bacterium]|nr:hypothetical protein [Lachnospiraceae bacterium]